MSEEHLICRVATGDRSAFADLYAALSPAVYTYLLRLVGNTGTAEDLLQEVFLAVWQEAARFRGASSVKTWVFRIAHNKAVSWLRQQRPTVPLSPTLSSEHDVEEWGMSAWNIARLGEALEHLPPHQRAVIELVFGQELSYAEVATVLGCPVGTVKSRVSYALRLLRHLLRDVATEDQR
ncbi:MAG: RNA polymerase sigma factor [Ardenticatenia bacterium]|nr:RNA polymerase sigma factor [Ardenticatenia bacterium]